MIVKEKILLELDVPTISGLTYPKELVPTIMTKIIHEDIGGIIQENPEMLNPNNIKPIFKIINPQCIVDESGEEPELLLICDVDIDEELLTEKELELINTKPWRLSVMGKADIDYENKIVKDFDLVYVNIEIVDESYYNNAE